MAERPILFSAPMVRAILREIEQPGTGKRETRRVLNRLRRIGAVTEFGRSTTRGYDWHLRDKGMRWHDLSDAGLRAVLPYAPGDQLWVRETWAKDPLIENGVRYYATDAVSDLRKKRSSIHMPRWASRITLTVSHVRVQRVQEISEADCIAEGIRANTPEKPARLTGHPNMSPLTYGDSEDYTLIAAYRRLWNSLNAQRGYSWDANPWVAAITFTPALRNIDAEAG